MKALEIIESLPGQVKEGSRLAKEIKVPRDIDAIVITGMGASAFPGDVIKTLLRQQNVPVVVNRDYSIPAFISSKTLVFASSYSGNTEETLSAYRQARRKRARIVGLTSGGKLRKICEKDKIPCIVMPSGIPPRTAIGYQLFSILAVLDNSGIVKISSTVVDKISAALKKTAIMDRAVELATNLTDKIPIIYSSLRLEAAALRWKQSFNEFAKTHAFHNVFSELNHNELMAYEFPKGNFHVIILRDEDDERQIQKRMELTKALLRQKGIPVTEILVKGDSLLTKLMTAVYLGDLTAYFLAKHHDIDPLETSLIEDFKKKLTK